MPRCLFKQNDYMAAIRGERGALVMIEYFNGYYFLYIALTLGLAAGLYALLRGKSERVRTGVLFGLLLSNFALHFLKLTLDFYRQLMPWALTTITPENICALNVLVFPWLFLCGKPLLRDYMFYIGVVSFGAVLWPVDVIGFGAFEAETLRYYYAHAIIAVVPLLMVLLGLHKLDYRRIVKVPLLFYLVLCIILVNEVILVGAGLVPLEWLLRYDVRNAALIFGPLPQLEPLGALLTALTPPLFLTVPAGVGAGAVYYWPIVWLVVPFFIYFCVLALLLALPFEHRRIRQDLLALRAKLKSLRK